MLFNKMTINFSDVLSENGLPLYTAVPAGALVMAEQTLSTGTFVSISNLIRGVGHLSVGSTTTGVPTSTAATMSSSGNHSSGSVLNTNNTNVAPAASYSVAGASAGSHSHTISNIYSGASTGLPLCRRLGFYSLPSGQTTLPAGAIVMSASRPSTDFTATTYTEWLAGASTTATVGTQGGSSSDRNWSVTTSTAGNHIHGSAGTAYDSSNTFLPQITLDSYNTVTAGAHSHTFTLAGNWFIGNYVTAKTWVSNGGALITSGCIVAWNSTSSTLPDGWVFCDGSTVRGVTTPNLIGNRMIKLDPNSHGVVNSGTNSFSAAPAFNYQWAGSHRHLAASQIARGNGQTAAPQHNTDSWFHNHSLSFTTPTTNPASTGLSFIMYIP